MTSTDGQAYYWLPSTRGDQQLLVAVDFQRIKNARRALFYSVAISQRGEFYSGKLSIERSSFKNFAAARRPKKKAPAAHLLLPPRGLNFQLGSLDFQLWRDIHT